jgi:spore photoproduct lyase
MNSTNFYSKLIRTIYVEESLQESPLLSEALENLTRHTGSEPRVRYVADRGEIPPQDLNPANLFVCPPRGDTVSACPGTRGHLCCNYMTVDLYVGCTLGCSYCIMQSYLKQSPVVVYLDPEPAIRRLEELAASTEVLRIGTGEVGDSLLYDPIFQLSRRFIAAAAPFPNVFFELKTKTAFVDHLLDVKAKGNAVIGFSLNPPRIIQAYEGISSPLEDRISAARRAVQSGYLVSFHFDPIVLFDGWEPAYSEVIALLDGIPTDRIAWISLGTLRYPPELKHKMGDHDFLLEEFVPCRDGKFRYLQKIRSALYRHLAAELRKRFSAPIYMCMESPAVWKNVFGEIPGQLPLLRDIFNTAVK